jgi:hypothetical protein
MATGRHRVLCGQTMATRDRRSLLAQQQTHQLARVVDPTCHNASVVLSGIAETGAGLSPSPDGCGVHAECATLQSNALPLHRTLLSLDDRARDGARYGVR